MIRKRGFLLTLAAEGLAPALFGSAVALRTERGIERFGPCIVQRWLDWMRDQPPSLRFSAVSELADLPLAKARSESIAAIESLTVDALAADRAVAVEYLAA